MVNGKIIMAVIISALILMGIYFFVSIGNVRESGNSVKLVGTGSSVMQNEKRVEITANGFSPSSLTISLGDTVNFVNKDTEKHWLVLELLGISNELSPDEIYSFSFNEVGVFEYYDNLNKNLAGTIIVE